MFGIKKQILSSDCALKNGTSGNHLGERRLLTSPKKDLNSNS